MIVFMYIRQREPAKIVSKEWKLTIVFLRGLNVVSPDGNSRTARLLMNYQLISDGFLPVSIAKENRLDYYNALEAYALQGELEQFVDLVAELEEDQLDTYIKLIER